MRLCHSAKSKNGPLLNTVAAKLATVTIYPWGRTIFDPPSDLAMRSSLNQQRSVGPQVRWSLAGLAGVVDIAGIINMRVTDSLIAVTFTINVCLLLQTLLHVTPSRLHDRPPSGSEHARYSKDG